MPDWIIRNSVGADLKRKSGKVQQQHWWDHTSKSSGGFSGGQVAALVGPHHSAQVSIQVLHSLSWPWMQPLVLQGTHNCPALLPLLVGPTSTKRQQLRMTSKGAREMEERVAKPFLMECQP